MVIIGLEMAACPEWWKHTHTPPPTHSLADPEGTASKPNAPAQLFQQTVNGEQVYRLGTVPEWQDMPAPAHFRISV